MHNQPPKSPLSGGLMTLRCTGACQGFGGVPTGVELHQGAIDSTASVVADSRSVSTRTRNF